MFRTLSLLLKVVNACFKHRAELTKPMSSGPFELLYQCDRFVAIDKPEGYFVHRPEDGSLNRFIRPDRVVLSRLRRQIRKKVYPGHRIDVATSGILVFALDPEAAKFFSFALQAGRAQKSYLGVCRGWFKEPNWQINIELESDSSGKLVNAETHFRKLAQIECTPGVPGDKYPSARYSLIEAQPITGRYHQIRRHLNRASHPLVGDNEHGDSRHNRFFREDQKVSGLCLRAKDLRVEMPELNLCLEISAPLNEKWQRLFEMFQVTASDLQAQP